MIKIKPYTEIQQRDEFIHLYRFIAAKAMPFYPEDLFPDGYFYPDGVTKTDLSYFKRGARTRTEKYKKLLKKYNMPEETKKSDKKHNDAELAKRIIDANSHKLHDYLYKSKDSVHVDTENLDTLLTASVGHDELNKLPFLAEALAAPEDAKKDLLDNVFRYEVFSKQQELYQLVYLLGVPVCPYCNRLYVTTVPAGNKKTRPQLDHYRNKSKYPFLALSIMNLVPSCGVCNQNKSDNSREILYPYAEEMGNLCSFYVDAEHDLTVLTGTGFNANDLTLNLVKKAQESPLSERIDASVDLLNLKRLYKSHRGYVSNMLMQRYIFTDDMVEDIKNVSGALFTDEQEVREMLLLGKLDQKHWGDRPLGKLTSDISKELDYLYSKKEK